MKRPPAPPPAVRPPVPVALLFALILLLGLAAYAPSLRGTFLWDDAGHVTRPELRSASGLARIWLEPGATQQYYPLLHSAFWLEHRLWGDAATGYRLANLLWHALSACLLIFLLRRLALPGAVFAGLAFALHPVAVESVAWIAEQKNTLSTVFALAAVLAWLRFEDDRRPGRYAVAALWFVAALLTKTVTATVPGALLVLAWWRRGRIDARTDVLPLLPWLALGAVAGLGTAWLEVSHIGASGQAFALGPVERGLLAGRIAWFYLGQIVWPANLAFFYPRWTIDAGAPTQWLFPLAVGAALTAGAWWSRRDRGPLAAMLLYGGLLLPALGFVNVYPFLFSYVADHFQYLASTALIAFLTAAGLRGWARLRLPSWSAPAIGAAVLLLLGGLTWRQSAAYRDEVALYEATLARNPDSWVAHLNLGTVLDDAGQSEAALPHLQQALQLKPDFPETLNSLGNVLNHLGRPAEALPLLDRALTLNPRFAAAHNTRGAALMGLGRTDEGLAAFRRAVALDPDLTLAQANLGWGLAHTGHADEALAVFADAVRRHPDDADLELKWGLVLAWQRQADAALPHLSRAVALRPDSTDARFALGGALGATGRVPEAIAQFEAILVLDPDHPGARQALAALGR